MGGRGSPLKVGLERRCSALLRRMKQAKHVEHGDEKEGIACPIARVDASLRERGGMRACARAHASV